jgi:hypothetical protein
MRYGQWAASYSVATRAGTLDRMGRLAGLFRLINANTYQSRPVWLLEIGPASLLGSTEGQTKGLPHTWLSNRVAPLRSGSFEL